MNKRYSGEPIFPAHIQGNKVQSVDEHCKNVAAYAKASLDCVGLGQIAYLAGLLHDCGKFTNTFREYIEAASRGKDVRKGSVIHSFAGVFYILSRNHKELNETALTAEVIAYAIGAHHGTFDCFDSNRESGFEHRLEKQPDYERRAIGNFEKFCASDDELTILFTAATYEIRNFLRKISSIAKSNAEVGFYIGLLTRLITAAVIEGDRRDTFEFMSGKKFAGDSGVVSMDWNEPSTNLENYLSGLSHNTPIQNARRDIADMCLKFASNAPGIYRLNVPTGGGKTLSSLRYAIAHAQKYGKGRIIYTAPLISILDQNAKVIHEAVGNDELILEHHSNIVRESDGEDMERYNLLTETWDSPILITTLVQLLNTFFSGRTACIRRFQALCNSIIIFDEVQSVPIKMLSLFNSTLNFLSLICNTTVILCSATQPYFEGLNHGLIVSEEEFFPQNENQRLRKIFKRTNIKNKGSYKLEEIPNLISEISKDVKSVLVICNTKREARKLFDSLSENCENVYHLSASMCMAHRNRALNDIYESLAANNGTICIATQVIEAGVDISFDLVIRLNSGMDSIIQAAGRCNRNGDNGESSDVYIVGCSDEKLGNLIEIKRAQDATNELIASFESNPDKYCGDLASDEAIEFYYKTLYRLQKSEAGASCFDFPVENHPPLYELLALNETYVDGARAAGKYVLRQAFKTAGTLFEVFDTDSETIIVPFGKGKDIIAEIAENSGAVKDNPKVFKKLLEKAKEYAVSIHKDQLKLLEKNGAVDALCDGRILVLKEEWYDSNTGLISNLDEKEDKACNILIL